MGYSYEELRTGIAELAEKMKKYIFIKYVSPLKTCEEW